MCNRIRGIHRNALHQRFYPTVSLTIGLGAEDMSFIRAIGPLFNKKCVSVPVLVRIMTGIRLLLSTDLSANDWY